MSTFQNFNLSIPGVVPADVADMLPEPAREKLTRLRDELDDLRFALHAEFDAVQEAIAAKQQAAARLRERTDPAAASRVGGTAVPDDHPSAVHARAALERAERDYSRLSARNEARAAKAQSSDRLVKNIERYLQTPQIVRVVDDLGKSAQLIGQDDASLDEFEFLMRIDTSGWPKEAE